MNWYLIQGLNPEPWTSPEASVARNKGTGNMVPVLRKGGQSARYQEALSDEVRDQVVAEPMIDPVRLELYFWRNIGSWETPAGRTAHAQHADATNLQKSTEDALQGVLFVNDNQVVDVRSRIMAQGVDVDPAILIGIAFATDPPAKIEQLRLELFVAPPESPSNLRTDFNVRDVF